jgi:hypothetical protein
MATAARKRESHPDDDARPAGGPNGDRRRAPEALVCVNIAEAWVKSRLCKQRTRKRK